MSMQLENKVFICDCHSPSHNFIISKDEEYNEVYLHVHLVPLPFWKRLKLGIKYIFGYTIEWGCYDTVILNEDKTKELKEFL